MTTTIRTARPIRYSQSRALSTLVDQIQVREDALRATGDHANADRMAIARSRVVDVAIGTRR